MITYPELKPYFELLSKIIWEMPFGGVEYSVKKDLTELQRDCCGDAPILLPNLIDRANHSIKFCYHKKQDISAEDLQGYIEKLTALTEFYEVKELNDAIAGLKSFI